MISTKEYKKPLKVGDLIWFNKGKTDGYDHEDIGYIKSIVMIRETKRYIVFWFKCSTDNPIESHETRNSIKDMNNSYIFPVL
jgi:hypothetical protein